MTSRLLSVGFRALTSAAMPPINAVAPDEPARLTIVLVRMPVVARFVYAITTDLLPQLYISPGRDPSKFAPETASTSSISAGNTAVSIRGHEPPMGQVPAA